MSALAQDIGDPCRIRMAMGCLAGQAKVTVSGAIQVIVAHAPQAVKGSAHGARPDLTAPGSDDVSNEVDPM